MLVDKPAAMTSHDVVQRVRRALGTRDAGHTGTLDPFATGLLIVLVGRATRLARFVEAQPKSYLATARLGIRTDTDDLTGRVISSAELGDLVSESRVTEALARFAGSHLQRPPQHSAKHVGGERSYHKARRGETVELAPTPVTVHTIDLVEYRPPSVTFRAVVGRGTYIRAIARDLGVLLGIGAHLTALRREAIGPLRVEDAVTPDGLTPAHVQPPASVLGHLPVVQLDASARQAVVHGRAVSGVEAEWAGGQGGGGAVALIADGELVAVATAHDGRLHPMVVLQTP